MASVINPNAAEDEPLRINLEEEAAEDGVTPAPAAPAAPATPAVGIEDLKRQLDAAENNRRMLAESARRMQLERDHANAVAAEAERRGISAQEVVNETRLNGVQEQLNSLAESQKNAYEAGEWGKVAEINLQLNKLGGELALLERDRAWLQQHREQYVAQQQARAYQAQQAAQQQPQLPSDPFERALVGRTQRTQQFLREHKDLVRPDGSLKRAAIEAHERALDEGLAVDTDAYFSKVEELLASDAPRQRQSKNTAAPSPIRPKGPPTSAAPVSRVTSGIPGFSGSEFTMTPRMRQLAEEQGIPPAEWAENYIRLVREGRMEPFQ